MGKVGFQRRDIIERSSQAGAVVGAVLGIASLAVSSGILNVMLYLYAAGSGFVVGFIAGAVAGLAGTLLGALAAHISPLLEQPARVFGALCIAASSIALVAALGDSIPSPWFVAATLAMTVLAGFFVLRERRPVTVGPQDDPPGNALAK